MSWLFSRYSASELAGVTQGAVFPSGVLNFLMLPHERSSVGVSVFAWAPVLPCLSHGWGQQKLELGSPSCVNMSIPASCPRIRLLSLTCSVFIEAMELICPDIGFTLRFTLLLLLYIPPLGCVEYWDWDCWGYTLLLVEMLAGWGHPLRSVLAW